MSLDARTHAERQAALSEELEAIRSSREAWDQTRREQLSARIAADEAAERAVRDRAEKARRAAAAAIASELRTELEGLFKRWRDQPSRPIAVSIAGTWTRFADRCLEEVGEPLWELCLAWPLLDLVGSRFDVGQIANAGAAAHLAGGSFGAAAAAATKAFSAGDPSGWYEAILRLETTIGEVLAMTGRGIHNAADRRLAAKRSAATRTDAVRAVEEVEAELASEAAARALEGQAEFYAERERSKPRPPRGWFTSI